MTDSAAQSSLAWWRAGAVAALLWTGLACGGTPQPRQVTVGGQPREYLLAAPSAPAAGALPLVLVLHGHLGSAANALGSGWRPSPLSAWVDIGEREGVLVAALQGLKGPDGHTGWHDCRSDDPDNTDADDVGFAAAVVAELVRSNRADPQRVFVMGMSNGAMMAYRLALQLQPTPLAIAAVSGTMARQSDCTGAPPQVSVLMINGTDDPVVPYGGGAVGLGRNKGSGVVGVAATLQFWREADQLAAAPAHAETLPQRGGDALTRAMSTRYGDPGGPEVESITVQGGGHVEPSLRYHYGPLYRRLVGVQNQDFESAEAAWQFFGGKRRRGR